MNYKQPENEEYDKKVLEKHFKLNAHLKAKKGKGFVSYVAFL